MQFELGSNSQRDVDHIRIKAPVVPLVTGDIFITEPKKPVPTNHFLAGYTNIYDDVVFVCVPGVSEDGFMGFSCR